jgi:hypothetical protein
MPGGPESLIAKALELRDAAGETVPLVSQAWSLPFAAAVSRGPDVEQQYNSELSDAKNHYRRLKLSVLNSCAPTQNSAYLKT